MFDYQTSGCTRFGAQMGRASDLPRDTQEACRLRQVPIDVQGYDPGGAYWGTPDNLYCVAAESDGACAYVRAAGLDAARAMFPRASWIAGVTEDDVSDMLETYVSAALWTSTDDSDASGGESLDQNYSAADIAPATLASMRRDCAAFLQANAADIGDRVADAGHDFYMTRTRSGVGFWETPDWPADAGQRLTKAAHAFGEVCLYVGDDGQIHG